MNGWTPAQVERQIELVQVELDTLLRKTEATRQRLEGLHRYLERLQESNPTTTTTTTS